MKILVILLMEAGWMKTGLTPAGIHVHSSMKRFSMSLEMKGAMSSMRRFLIFMICLLALSDDSDLLLLREASCLGIAIERPRWESLSTSFYISTGNSENHG